MHSRPGLPPTLLHIKLVAAHGAAAIFDEGSPPAAHNATVVRQHVRLGRGRSSSPLTVAAEAAAAATAAAESAQSAAAPSPMAASPAVGGEAAPTQRMAGLQMDERWELEGKEDLWLLNLQAAEPGGDLARISALLRRLDDLSHVLAWAAAPAEGAPAALRRVELPRVRLSFEALTLTLILALALALALALILALTLTLSLTLTLILTLTLTLTLLTLTPARRPTAATALPSPTRPVVGVG